MVGIAHNGSTPIGLSDSSKRGGGINPLHAAARLQLRLTPTAFRAIWQWHFRSSLAHVPCPLATRAFRPVRARDPGGRVPVAARQMVCVPQGVPDGERDPVASL